MNSKRYLVVDGCGAMVPYAPRCQDHTGITCDGIELPSKSSTLTNGFETRNSTISSRWRGSELCRTTCFVGRVNPKIIVGRFSFKPIDRESSMLK